MGERIHILPTLHGNTNTSCELWNTARYIPHLRHKTSNPAHMLTTLDSVDHRSTILGSRPHPTTSSLTDFSSLFQQHSLDWSRFRHKTDFIFSNSWTLTVKLSRSHSYVAVCKSTVHLLGFPTGALLWTLDHREPTLDHMGPHSGNSGPHGGNSGPLGPHGGTEGPETRPLETTCRDHHHHFTGHRPPACKPEHNTQL